MTDKQSIDRAELIRLANLVRPALSTQAYVPALTHIRFTGREACAYNDISAIAVRCDLGVSRCVPGDLLIRALSSFGAAEVSFADGKEGAFVLKSGRSTLKLPTLVEEDFPFEWPSTKDCASIEVTPAMLAGIKRCLISVSNDPTHPAQMGVTLDPDADGHAVLFSTDNFSISRFQTKNKVKLPGDAPLILPTFFCEQLVSLAAAYPKEDIDLYLLTDGLVVTFGREAKLFSKTLVDLEPLDFHKVIARQMDYSKLKPRLTMIPDSFDAALGRALLVLGAEVDKVTHTTVAEGRLTMHSTSAMGDSDDSMGFATDSPLVDVHIDPALVARGTKVCALMVFTEKALILADAECVFVHIVAHCGS